MNCKLKVKQAINKQDCDKVPLIMICIDSLTAKLAHSVYNINISVYSTEHSLSIIFLIMGDV